MDLLHPDVCSYGTLISGFVKSMKVFDALELFEEMSERGIDLDVICYNILDRKSTRLNSSHRSLSRMPSSA